jgi:hypothetical protein
MRGAFLVLPILACGHASMTFPDDAATAPDSDEIDASDDTSIAPGDAPSGDVEAGISCPAPPPQLDGGTSVVMAAQFQKDYYVYDLGNPPGVTGRLGGCTVHYQDADTLLIAGDSEETTGAIYSIKLKRDLCGHILGFSGMATKIATTPYVDANLLYVKSNLLFYSEWPIYTLGQLLPNAMSPARETNLQSLGMAGGGTGGIGFAPAYLPMAVAGKMRGVTWPDGYWYHIDLTPDGNLFTVSAVTQIPGSTLPGGPGGFAYVPPGSPDFAMHSVIMAEWSANKVATYAIDMNGDPDPKTRVEFFTAFPRPWGAYFDRISGDYLFLTWGAGPPDEVYVVRGFAVPPPPPPPPK